MTELMSVRLLLGSESKWELGRERQLWNLIRLSQDIKPLKCDLSGANPKNSSGSEDEFNLSIATAEEI